MGRMIDVDALKLSMMLIAPGETKKYCYPCKEVLEAIENAPTIEERKTGKWIGVTPMVDTLMCSECEYNIINKEFKTPYCPNCGAKMEGEQP